MVQKKLEFTPESGNVDTYNFCFVLVLFLHPTGAIRAVDPRHGYLNSCKIFTGLCHNHGLQLFSSLCMQSYIFAPIKLNNGNVCFYILLQFFLQMKQWHNYFCRTH